MTQLHRYKNGNCTVMIHSDGTKVREWPDGETAAPEFPESLDLKITNACDRNCKWCHESAGTDEHADYSRLLGALEGLPRGVEIAIGGGNPLEHPKLLALLGALRRKRLVANMTLAETHAIDIISTLAGLRADRLLYGLGISGLSESALQFLPDGGAPPSWIVAHTIAGVGEPLDTRQLRRAGCNVLVLGYKQHGRGAAYYDKRVANNIGKWQYFLPTILRVARGVLSFDNLALEQLDVRRYVSAEEWDAHYMGDDGAFTMYYDAVANEYAASSIGPRVDAGAMTIPEMFRSLTARS